MNCRVGCSNVNQLLSGVEMLKRFFEYLELMMVAATYLLILIIGLEVVTLVVAIVGVLAYRFFQFFWDLIGQYRWLG